MARAAAGVPAPRSRRRSLGGGLLELDPPTTLRGQLQAEWANNGAACETRQRRADARHGPYRARNWAHREHKFLALRTACEGFGVDVAATLRRVARAPDQTITDELNRSVGGFELLQRGEEDWYYLRRSSFTSAEVRQAYERTLEEELGRHLPARRCRSSAHTASSSLRQLTPNTHDLVGPFPAGRRPEDYDQIRRRVMWAMPHGLYLLGSRSGDRRNLMTTTWVTQVSHDPKLVGASVEREALTHELDSERQRCFGLAPRARPIAQSCATS